MSLRSSLVLIEPLGFRLKMKCLEYYSLDLVGEIVFAVEKEVSGHRDGQHLVRQQVEQLLADVDEPAMGAVEELTELVEADAGLQRLALAVLDALQFQLQRLGGHIAQPEDDLQGLALNLAQGNGQDMLELTLVRAQFLVQTVREGGRDSREDLSIERDIYLPCYIETLPIVELEYWWAYNG